MAVSSPPPGDIDYFVIGGCPQLGDWELDGAVALFLNASTSNYEATVDIPVQDDASAKAKDDEVAAAIAPELAVLPVVTAAQVEFKHFLRAVDGDGEPVWQGGANKVIDLKWAVAAASKEKKMPARLCTEWNVLRTDGTGLVKLDPYLAPHEGALKARFKM